MDFSFFDVLGKNGTATAGHFFIYSRGINAVNTNRDGWMERWMSILGDGVEICRCDVENSSSNKRCIAV